MSLSRMKTISLLIVAMRKKYWDETSTCFTDKRQGKNRRNKDLIRTNASFWKVGHMGGTSYLFLIWLGHLSAKQMIWYTQMQTHYVNHQLKNMYHTKYMLYEKQKLYCTTCTRLLCNITYDITLNYHG